MRNRSGTKDRSGAAPSPLVLVVALLSMAGLFLAIMPIRTYLTQRNSEQSVSHQLASISAENRSLSQQIARLSTPSQIEYIARSRYGLVQQGERSYVILPAPTSGNSVGAVPQGSAVPTTTTTTNVRPRGG